MNRGSMHIHIVAVAGTGMGALAGLLKEQGHDVSGSDVHFDPPMGPALREWGVRCLEGFSPEHLEPAPELVVIGNVCRRDNPEAAAAIERGLPYTHLPGALQRFVLEGYAPLVVAGTHGKTTTTALAAYLFEATGWRPGYLVGGILANDGRSFRAPRARPRSFDPSDSKRRAPFVIEGDEYDTAFFEKTAKFLHYRAEVAIITSVEHDHVDIYPTEELYLEAFRRFIAGVPEHGLIVANCADETVVRLVTSAARAEVSWYAVEGQDWHGQAPHWLSAPAFQVDGAQTFELFAGGTSCGRLALPLAGRHNLGNATAALGALAQGYQVRLSELARVLPGFQGVKRRQELLGEPGGVSVYDDFAHHPTAVAATLAALRLRHPSQRLWAVFEPRSATACRRLHQQAYAESFGAADQVLLAPLGRTGLPPGEALDVGLLAERLREAGKEASACGSVEELLERLVREARAGDVVALLSNGSFGGLHQRLLASLAARGLDRHEG